MKTKTIKNNKEKIIFVSDIVVAILCIVVTEISIKDYTLFGAFTGYLKLIMSSNANLLSKFIATILILVTEVFSVITTNYIIIILYLSFRLLRKKIIKKNKQVEVINNIEYFRDVLIDITPSEISLIADLEIESKKDIVASMIGLYQKQIIDFEDNKVVVKKEDIKLRRSDRKLLEMIIEEKFNNLEVKEWKEICISEALKDNLIKRNWTIDNKENKNKKIGIIKIIACIIISISVIYIVNPQNEQVVNNVDKKIEKMQEFKNTYEKISELNLAMENNEFAKIYSEFLLEAAPLIIAGIGIVSSILVLTSIPIYKASQKKISNKMSASKYERTRKRKNSNGTGFWNKEFYT